MQWVGGEEHQVLPRGVGERLDPPLPPPLFLTPTCVCGLALSIGRAEERKPTHGNRTDMR